MHIFLADDSASIALGQQLAHLIPNEQFSIHLEGQLGAGKTTLSRGFIQALGHKGNVKSPTYTLVEQYHLNHRDVYHFDLYRLSDPEELDYLGLDDYFSNNTLCLIEWPQKGGAYLPTPDLTITLNYQQQSRQAEIVAHTEKGQTVYKNLK